MFFSNQMMSFNSADLLIVNLKGLFVSRWEKQVLPHSTPWCTWQRLAKVCMWQRLAKVCMGQHRRLWKFSGKLAARTSNSI